jgi:putative nucleotidyltransferase with HDIG domain
MQISIHHMVQTLSRAVDLVGVTDVYHGRRVGIISVEVGRRMGLAAPRLRQVFEAGLLHDCGVSSTVEHTLITGEENGVDFSSHCQRGAAALSQFPPLASLSSIVLNHHTDWAALPAENLRAEEAAITSLVHLSDRVDALCSGHYRDESLLLHVDAIRSRISAGRGRQFSPDVVDAFLAASRPEAFWLLLDVAYIPQYMQDMEAASRPLVGTLDELRAFARLIATIVDGKSHFTAQHSIGVARLARLLGELRGFEGEHLAKIEIAALLHDIGKLQVPDAVLESPRALSPAERAIIKKHSFATYQILRQVGGFDELARWAALHHECPSGKGYPFRLTAEEICEEAAIIKVSDVYQALAQKRPYRGPMPPQAILAELKRMAAAREVDETLVSLVGQHLEACHEAAVGEG